MVACMHHLKTRAQVHVGQTQGVVYVQNLYITRIKALSMQTLG